MKRIFTSLAASCMAVGALFAETTVVYLNGTDGKQTNDGLTPETPVNTLTKAFERIAPENDGVIVVMGKFTQSDNFAPNALRHEATITFTQVYNGVDYRGDDHKANAWTFTKGLRIGLTANTRFENITFNHTGADGNRFVLMYANYHKLTFGEGVEVLGDYGWTNPATSFTLLGGCQDNDNKAKPDMSPCIDIASGDFYIGMYNRGINTNFKKNDEMPTHHGTLNVSGGTIHRCYAGSIFISSLDNCPKSGSTEINITGGDIKHLALGTVKNSGTMDGTEVVVNISGGKFPYDQCLFIPAPELDADTRFELNLTGMPIEDQYSLLSYTTASKFDKIMADILVPEKTFDSAVEVLGDDSQMPYRHYTTPGGTPQHLVLYLHGLGSRGTDNSLHVCGTGAAPLYRIQNAGENMIILAPQLPAGAQWLSGAGGFTFAGEASCYLDAAVSLAKKTAADNNIPAEHMYLVGSSNGAAAIWYLLNRTAPDFSKGMPIAGYAEESTDIDALGTNIAPSLIWAFHGTDDTTIPVDFMQAAAPRLKELSKNFEYTEYEGATHNNIYALAAQTPGVTDFFFKKSPVSGISDVPTGDVSTGITVDGSSINVISDGPVVLYNLAGATIGSASGPTVFDSLPAGMYIISTGSKAYKAAVR